MAFNKIDLRALKAAVDDILDHLIEDLALTEVTIAPTEDAYWVCSPSARYDSSRVPLIEESASLSDDVEFVGLVRRGEGSDVSYNLVHVAPLLEYIGEKIKK